MIIKKIVFNVYNFYHKYFPYKKGKHLIARILDKICKSFIIKSNSYEKTPKIFDSNEKSL